MVLGLALGPGTGLALGLVVALVPVMVHVHSGGLVRWMAMGQRLADGYDLELVALGWLQIQMVDLVAVLLEVKAEHCGESKMVEQVMAPGVAMMGCSEVVLSNSGD